MGGNGASLRTYAVHAAVAALLGVFALGACDSDDDAGSEMVEPADAITAAVAWQADEQEPVLGDDGEPILPVVFVVPGEGTTIDVGIQAEVASETADWATVRFADNAADTFDPDIDGEPVRDDGVMLLLGPIPEPARSIELDLVRYVAVDVGEPLILDIVAEPSPTDTSDTPAPRATVTSVTQP